MTVTDLLGRSVRIPSQPKRIVAISPTAVEYVYAVGGSVVGRPSSAEYPPEVKSVSDVGTAYAPSFEGILALNPDLVVADSLIHAQPSLRSAIEQLGVPTLFAGAGSYDDVVAGITLLGTALDAKADAAALVADIDGQLGEAKKLLNSQSVSALVVISDRNQVIYAANGNSYIGDLMDILGITNPLGDQADSGPQPGFTTAPPDLLLKSDPDYLLTLSPAPPPAPPLSQVITSVPGLNGLKAAKQPGHIAELDVVLALQAAGPRIGETALALAEAVTAGQ